MAKILIVSKGYLGDMFPMLAIAKRLLDRGHEVSFAADGNWEAATGHLKLPLIRLDRMRTATATAPERSARSRFPALFRFIDALVPHSLAAQYEIWRGAVEIHAFRTLAAECETLLSAAAGHALIVGNQLAYAGALVSRKLHIPWVYCAPSPLAIPSRLDPPLFPMLHRLQALTIDYPWTQPPYFAFARMLGSLVAHSVVVQQRRMGIPASGNPRFEGLYSDRLNLIAASPLLVRPAADWPPNTVVTGVAWFEPEHLRDEARSQALSQFLASGTPPVVFGAGGPARARPGRLYIEGIKACNLLGSRAVVIAADHLQADLPRSPNVLIGGFVPYTDLFPSAAAVVHSGGIGTCAWTVRSGTPSLLLPSSWDHFDNARRMQQQRLASVMSEGEYRAPGIAERLERLLSDREQRQALQLYGPRMAVEDGAGVACAAIESLLREG